MKIKKKKAGTLGKLADFTDSGSETNTFYEFKDGLDLLCPPTEESKDDTISCTHCYDLVYPLGLFFVTLSSSSCHQLASAPSQVCSPQTEDVIGSIHLGDFLGWLSSQTTQKAPPQLRDWQLL
jgi:hypothetical protein